MSKLKPGDRVRPHTCTETATVIKSNNFNCVVEFDDEVPERLKHLQVKDSNNRCLLLVQLVDQVSPVEELATCTTSLR